MTFPLMLCGRKPLDLSSPQVMGILNVTPDSFSDGGRYNDPDAAVAQAISMAKQGAAIIDIGGESTRPGAAAVSVQQELDRVIPVIEKLAPELSIPISIDTQKPQVMQAAVQAGAGMINDVNALQADDALAVAAKAEVPVCLMHMQGTPQTMQADPRYQNVVAQVRDFLQVRMTACVEAGIKPERILVDPGFGFGKTLENNIDLLKNLDQLKILKVPILVGISNKSMLGAITGSLTGERLAASLAAAVLAVQRGGDILRVHDVKATVDAIKITLAVINE